MKALPVLLPVLLSFICISTTSVVKAVEEIYIREDGGISPPESALRRRGNVYEFTADIANKSVIVQKDDIEIHGMGWSLRGPGALSVPSRGFYLRDVKGVLITRVKISGFYEAFRADISEGIRIRSNEISSNAYGIYSTDSSSITVEGNEVRGNDGGGIYVANSHNVSLSHNLVIGNRWYGVRLLSTTGCVVAGNQIADNRGNGIWLALSGANFLHHNNIVNNTRQVLVEEPILSTEWDNGYEGNFWSDQIRVDGDSNGICDLQYQIDQDNSDRYPLMGTFTVLEDPLRRHVSVISNSTLANVEYIAKNSTIRAGLSARTQDLRTYFSRICISKNLLIPPYIALADGGTGRMLQFDEALFDNGTHRWIYVVYEGQTKGISVVGTPPKGEPFPILIVALISALSGLLSGLLAYLLDRKTRMKKATARRTELKLFKPKGQ